MVQLIRRCVARSQMAFGGKVGYYFRPDTTSSVMNQIFPKLFAAVILVVLLEISAVRAQSLDRIGVTILRATTTSLDGSGIRVAQPEANTDSNTSNPSAFEVNPATVNQPASRFTYFSAAGATNDFPNLVGNASGHAGSVGGLFYGVPNGVATNVAHVDNLDANYFYSHYVSGDLTTLADPVVNQSFTFGNVSTNQPTPAGDVSVSDQSQIDSAYDNYAAGSGTLFISAVNNGGFVSPPGTAYNCIGVAAYGGGSSIGPTLDNGRCKPDITAPADETSFSTPQVAGAAALLMQAARRGDGGGDTNSAADLRTIKALLLNGAVKPVNWTNSSASPLDARYGAGVLNVFNSYEQLVGGKHDFNDATTVSTGAAHPPPSAAATVDVLSGWNFATNSSGFTTDSVQHYYFNITNVSTATTTLVWDRQKNQTGINNLNLFLYDCANGHLVACSTSLVDNVEHIFVPQLAPGRYDLQVWKAGGVPGLGIVSAAEPYALAFAFTSVNLNLTVTGPNVSLTWPAYPAGFRVETTASLSSPAWTTNQLPASTFTNGQNVLWLNATNSAQFFRLARRP